MVFFSVRELVEIVILIFATGYILSGFIQKPRSPYETHNRFFDWEDLKFSAMIAAPAVLFHELGHKFVAIGFGLNATFHIFPLGLGLGVILKLISSPLIILAPGYVSFPATAGNLASGLIAFAGPGVNLLLWGISAYVLKNKSGLSQNQAIGWAVSKKFNMFLFLFNMIPFPPLDGYHILNSVLAIL